MVKLKILNYIKNITKKHAMIYTNNIILSWNKFIFNLAIK